jgi:hypothetical protein
MVACPHVSGRGALVSHVEKRALPPTSDDSQQVTGLHASSQGMRYSSVSKLNGPQTEPGDTKGVKNEI